MARCVYAFKWIVSSESSVYKYVCGVQWHTNKSLLKIDIFHFVFGATILKTLIIIRMQYSVLFCFVHPPIVRCPQIFLSFHALPPSPLRHYHHHLCYAQTRAYTCVCVCLSGTRSHHHRHHPPYHYIYQSHNNITGFTRCWP